MVKTDSTDSAPMEGASSGVTQQQTVARGAIQTWYVQHEFDHEPTLVVNVSDDDQFVAFSKDVPVPIRRDAARRLASLLSSKDESGKALSPQKPSIVGGGDGCRMRTIRFYGIDWDADDQEAGLPSELILQVSPFINIVDEGADVLSNETGWCVNGFNWEELDLYPKAGGLVHQMVEAFDRLADGEDFDAVVEQTGITSLVCAAARPVPDSRTRWQEICASQGWNGDSQLTHLLRFIEEVGLMGGLLDYAMIAAREENEQRL